MPNGLEAGGNLLRELQLRCALPCGAASFALPADNERCQALLVFHVDEGEIEGVEVSGLSIALLADTPGMMIDGGWRVGVYMDEQASEDQANALGAVFSGQKGGPMEDIAPLIGEMLGIERAPIEYSEEGTRHHAKIGDDIEIVVEDFMPEAIGEVSRVTNVAHPANTTLSVAQATTSRIKGFGLDISNEGKNGHSAPFSWAA
ncbi:MAG: DUF1326 domain-containing protein [Actinomycetota bacterium]|nr:DUF1326 domain-containing protein [Actinomycetota bacterium]